MQLYQGDHKHDWDEKNLPLGGKYPGSHPPGGLPHQPPPGGDAEDHGDHPDGIAEGLLDDDDDLLAQVNLQLQRESLVKKQRRDLVKPPSAKSSRSSSTDRGCCRIVADAISTFVQVIIGEILKCKFQPTCRESSTASYFPPWSWLALQASFTCSTNATWRTMYVFNENLLQFKLLKIKCI